MRCKVGDLAVIVRGENNIGRFVNVLMPSPLHGAGWWFVEMVGGPGDGIHYFTKVRDRGVLGNISDARLRPIRDPGEDAVDEMLQLLGSPVKETA